MKKFCESLGEHTIINFRKKKMRLLTNEQQESYQNAKICHNCQKSLKINMLPIKNIIKLEITAIIQVNIEVLRIVYVI